MDKQEAESPGGIIIPDKHQEKAQTGTVLRTGIWKINKLGHLIPYPVRKGDKVLINKRMGRWVHGPKSKLKLIRMEDVLAILA